MQIIYVRLPTKCHLYFELASMKTIFCCTNARISQLLVPIFDLWILIYPELCEIVPATI